MEINFINEENNNIHFCTSFQKENIIVWKCPICPNYERTYNLISGKMTVKGKIDEIQHQGYSSAAQNLDNLTKNITEN